MGKLIAVALLLLVGCGSRPYATRYQVVLDPTFTDEESGRILSGLDAWTDAVGVRFDVVFDNSFVTGGCAGKDDRICFVPAALRQGLEGWTDRSDHTQSSTIQVDRLDTGPAGNSEWFDFVVRHETGHALGLHHTQYGTLMYRFISPGARVTCGDRQQYWDLRTLTDLGCPTPYVLSGQ